jgi:hypothetical protein
MERIMITLGDLRRLDLPDDTIINLEGILPGNRARSVFVASVTEHHKFAYYSTQESKAKLALGVESPKTIVVLSLRDD